MIKKLLTFYIILITAQANEQNIKINPPILYTKNEEVHKEIKKQSENLNQRQLKNLKTTIPNLEIFKEQELQSFVEDFNRKVCEWSPLPIKPNILVLIDKIQLKSKKYKNTKAIEILTNVCLDNKINISLDNGFIILHKGDLQINELVIKPNIINSQFYKEINFITKGFFYMGQSMEDMIEPFKRIQKDFNPKHEKIRFIIEKKPKKEKKISKSPVDEDAFDDDFFNDDDSFKKRVNLSGSNIHFLELVKYSCLQTGYTMEIKNKTIILSQQ
jgi:hypothetical protein